MPSIDPFGLKRYSRLHPRRLAFKALSVMTEVWSRLRYESYRLPMKKPSSLPPELEFDQAQTAVTPLAMQCLTAGMLATESIDNTCVVEIGAYRGITTRCLAEKTRRVVIAVDPYVGYGGSEQDLEVFRANTADCANVRHVRTPSGQAAAQWSLGPIGFIFIDAIHDYHHVIFDILTWKPKLAPGGLMALHDTDNPRYPGARRAVAVAAKGMELWAHIPDLTVFRKGGG